jgi:hypothetical protein
MQISRFVALALCLFAGASAARANTVSIVGDGSTSSENLGRFEGTLSYQFNATTSSGKLTVVLKNTTSSAIGGYLTAFLFNVRGTALAVLWPEAGSSFWTTNPTGESGSPFGTFEAGAALNGDRDPWGDFLGGGSPSNGIAAGASKTFQFLVIGSGAAGLTSHSFLQDSGVGGSNRATFLARFKGMTQDRSDKVAAAVVPIPAAVWGGLLLLGAVGAHRHLVRRRMRAGTESM